MRNPLRIARLVTTAVGVGISFLSALMMLGVMLQAGFLTGIEKNLAVPLDYGIYGTYFVGFFLSLLAGCWFLERLLNICEEFDR